MGETLDNYFWEISVKDYQAESLELLENEFCWFPAPEIKRAFTICETCYTQTRNFMINLIRPRIPSGFDPNSVDPRFPKYPMVRLLPPRVPRFINHPIHGKFKTLEASRVSRRMILRNCRLTDEVHKLLFENSLTNDGHPQNMDAPDFDVPNNETLLRQAVRNGDLPQIICFFYNEGVDINLRNAKGDTILHDACGWGWIEIVNFLLEVQVLYQLGAGGRTPLHQAAAHGHLPVVQALLETLGADGALINTRDTWNGASALHLASHFGYSGVVSVLLLNGADANLEDYSGCRPLDVAFKGGHEDIAELLNPFTK